MWSQFAKRELHDILQVKPGSMRRSKNCPFPTKLASLLAVCRYQLPFHYAIGWCLQSRFLFGASESDCVNVALLFVDGPIMIEKACSWVF
jgi:hypothetical protein